MKKVTENPFMLFLTVVSTIGSLVALSVQLPDVLALAFYATVAFVVIVYGYRSICWLIDYVTKEIDEQVADDVQSALPPVQRIIHAVPLNTQKLSLQDEIRIPDEWRPNQSYYKLAFNELYYQELGEHGEAVRQFKNEFLQWISFQVGSHIENYPGVNRLDTEERYYVTGIERARQGKLGDENWRLIATHLRNRVLAFTAQYGNPKQHTTVS